MEEKKNLVSSITPDHIHIFESLLLDAYGHVSRDLFAGALGADVPDSVWLDVIGLAVIDALYQTAISDPYSELQFGMGSQSSSRESEELRKSVAKGISLLEIEPITTTFPRSMNVLMAMSPFSSNRMLFEVASHAALLVQNNEWGDEPSYAYACELLIFILGYLATLEQRSQPSLSLFAIPKQPSLKKALIGEVDEHASYHPLWTLGEPGIHQPLILLYPVQRSDMEQTPRILEGLVEITDPRIELSRVGHGMVTVDIRPNSVQPYVEPWRWRIGPLGRCFQKFGEDIMSWPNVIPAAISDSSPDGVEATFVSFDPDCYVVATPLNPL